MSAVRITVHSVLGIEALTGADYRLSLSLQMTDGQNREAAAQLLGSMPTDKVEQFLRSEFAELFDDAQAPVAQPAGEPVAWAAFAESGAIRVWTATPENVRKLAAENGWVLTPLYTASPAAARVPMTRDRILELAEPFGAFEYGDAQGDARIAFARAIEAAGQEGGAA